MEAARPSNALLRAACFVIIGLAPFAAEGADLFKWVDEKGRTHYGESIPDQYRKKGTRIERTISEPTDAQRRDAAERSAKEKLRAESADVPGATPNAPPAAPQPTASNSNVRADSCEEQKQRYLESDHCFAPFRNANGSIRAEAFRHCVEVKEPKC